VPEVTRAGQERAAAVLGRLVVLGLVFSARSLRAETFCGSIRFALCTIPNAKFMCLSQAYECGSDLKLCVRFKLTTKQTHKSSKK